MVPEAYATMNKTNFLGSQSLHWRERESWEEMDQKVCKQINKPSLKLKEEVRRECLNLGAIDTFNSLSFSLGELSVEYSPFGTLPNPHLLAPQW